ncbi:MAG: SRPBCC domain-containing protein [Gemmatimonadetes bacterium]|nr:SRPBCC domain-containing protein [Gemmatimonadota bacterium]
MNASMDALVDVSVTIEARPETVWSIISTPEGFSDWMDGVVRFEPLEGSPFRAEFPSFATVISGEVETFDAEARRLTLTWGVESGPQAESFPAGSSLVDIQVLDDREGCRVQLRHTRLPSDMEVEQHAQGWRFHLSRMALKANRSELDGSLSASLEGWFAAWNEPDETARLALLQGCCDDEIEFRDEWSSTRGVELLSLHISNSLRFMPGWRLEPSGEPRVCRGEALFDWRSDGPSGEVVEGTNHARVGFDGRLRRVTGFPNP